MDSDALTDSQDESETAGLLSRSRLREVEAAYRDISLCAFPIEMRVAHTLAYLRTSAAPRIASLTAYTGHVEHAPLKRATDTGLLMYELFYNGFESPQGRAVVSKLKHMHQRWSIRNEDYLYVLGTFAVLGPQTINRYAWRKLTAEESQDAVDFFRELGTRMGVTEIPTTYPEFAHFFENYERRHLRATPAGHRIMEASWNAAASNLPRSLRPLARAAVSTLTDEPARSAMGLRAPHRLTQAVIKAAVKVRGRIGRVKDPRSAGPDFTPGGTYEVYPESYTIDDLGVGAAARHPVTTDSHSVTTEQLR